MLHQVLLRWADCRQLRAEPELHCVHHFADSEIFGLVAIARATEHVEKQTPNSQRCTMRIFAYSNRKLVCILSVHVDGIKGAGLR